MTTLWREKEKERGKEEKGKEGERKINRQIRVSENIEKWEPVCTSGGNVKYCSHCGNQKGSRSKYEK